MEVRTPAQAVVPGTVLVESELVRGVVELVASGASARVTVAGLRSGGILLDLARSLAVGRGIRVTPCLAADDIGVDLIIERDRDGS